MTIPFSATLAADSMAGLDGRGVVREMRRRSLWVPAVLLSAEQDLGTIAAQQQIAEFLSKPVELERLRRTLLHRVRPTDFDMIDRSC